MYCDWTEELEKEIKRERRYAKRGKLKQKKCGELTPTEAQVAKLQQWTQSLTLTMNLKNLNTAIKNCGRP